MSTESVHTLFETLPLSLLVFDKREMVSLLSTTTVEEALRIFYRENVLAMPVFDEAQNRFVGILSMFEIMTYVAFGCFKFDTPHPSEAALARSTQAAVGELLQLQDDPKVWEFRDTDLIRSVLEPMSKGVHRIVVDCPYVNEHGVEQRRPRILTQTDLVRFLLSFSQHGRVPADHVADINKSLAELNVVFAHAKEPLYTLPDSVTAVDAFRKLYNNGKHAAPIVTSDGHIVGTLSESDLRGLRSSEFRLLELPVLEFVKTRRGGQLPPAVSCLITDSLKHAALLMINKKTHRVWVVNEQNQPVGVVSMSDFICKFSPADFLV